MRGRAVVALLVVLTPALADVTATDRAGDPLPVGALARLGSTRFRNHWGAFATAYSADGKHLASLSYHEASIASVQTGAREQSFGKLEVGFEPRVAWSPDGTLVAFATHRELLVGKAVGGEAWRWRARHDSGTPEFIRALAWAPDSSRLAVATTHAPTFKTAVHGMWMFDRAGTPAHPFATIDGA
ncbi:MAG: PD40 domain-containing protein, partial [Deltaproteobacteria bacterium]|nr:PD40 domain-containing protein [Deltaproteobacteria bacterium]